MNGYAIRNDLKGWRAVSSPDDCAADEHYSAAQPAPVATPDAERAAWKLRRAERVSEIQVTTTAGHTFDGDEESQSRMARAILGLQVVPAGTVTWVLADNSVQEVGAAELTEALALAGAEQARLWVTA